jgi:signal transduction histidine kinase
MTDRASLLRKYCRSVVALLTGCVLLYLTFELFVFKKIIADVWLALLIYYLLIIVMTSAWYLARNRLPGTSKKKIGISIALYADDNQVKIRLRDEFGQYLMRALQEHQMRSYCDILVFDDFWSLRASRLLNTCVDQTATAAMRPDGTVKRRDIDSSPKSRRRCKKQLRGHFYLWGSIRQAAGQTEAYVVSIDALVTDTPVPASLSHGCRNDVVAVLYTKIFGSEAFVTKELQLAAQHLYIAGGGDHEQATIVPDFWQLEVALPSRSGGTRADEGSESAANSGASPQPKSVPSAEHRRQVSKEPSPLHTQKTDPPADPIDPAE